MASPHTLECSTSKDSDGNKLDEKREAEFTIENFPATVQEAVDLYGEEVVFDFFERSADVKAQNVARSMLKDGHSQESIQEEMSDWDPTTTRSRSKTPDRSIEDQFGDLAPEEQDKLLRKLAEKSKQEQAQAQAA